jgi:endoglycosylceramidase
MLALAGLLGAAAVAWGCSGAKGGSTSPARPAPDATVAASSVPYGAIGHSGRWLTDAAGRVLQLHGVNMVAKEPPYEPAAAGFSDDDAAWLAQNGFRVVRLGVLATGLMPTPGKVDEAYIESIAASVDDLARHGIYTLIDFHQDGWGPSIGDDGFPGWMTETKDAKDTHTGFPLYYVTNPAIQQAFQSFWDDDAGPGGGTLQSQYATMFSTLARRLAGNPNVLGYDLFNEPWPGNKWGPCLGEAAGCPDLDRAELGAT